MVKHDEEFSLSLVGRQLGDYRVLRRLGRGGMSNVYLAEQLSLKRRVAIKVLKSDLAEDEMYVRRFHKEAQAAAALVHANIVQIHEVGETDGIHFIAQEYVDGQNLRQYLKGKGVVDLRMGLSIINQVAAALHKAGQSGIIHRDIKPENIMLAPSGEVKVADFGLARVINSDNGDSMDATQVGMTMGTPLYMSPEQAEGGEIDPRSDLYSLGVTAYHMFSGRTPFEGDNALSIAVQHLKKEPDPILSIRNDLPEELAALVHQLLSKKPEQRFQSAAELVKEIRAISVEGLDDTWSPSFEITDTSLSDHPDGRMAVTQQLSTLMKSAADRPKLFTPGWIIATLLFLALGAAIGISYAPASLLEDAQAGTKNEIEMKQSVDEQFTFAAFTNSEEALLSVKRYYPPGESAENQYYALLVDKKLAVLYQQNNQFEKAIRIFTRFTEAEGDNKTLGYCGLANIAHVQGNKENVELYLSKLSSLVSQLDASAQSQATSSLNDELFDELNALLISERSDVETPN